MINESCLSQAGKDIIQIWFNILRNVSGDMLAGRKFPLGVEILWGFEIFVLCRSENYRRGRGL